MNSNESQTKTNGQKKENVQCLTQASFFFVFFK